MRRAAFALLLLSACNLKQIAMRSLADAIAEPGDVYSRDDDPELVRESIPVMLKLMEQLESGLPKHKPIHLALARSFTSYAAGFLEEDADRLHEIDVERARPLYARARRLSWRAYNYGLAGLDLAAPGFRAAFEGNSREERERVLKLITKDDAALLYWTGAALGTAIACAKDDMKLVGMVPLVEKLMKRGLEVDEAYDEGAFHEFFVTYDSKNAKSAKEHLDRALALDQRKKLGPLVSYAEGALVEQQNKAEFKKTLDGVLAFNVDDDPPHRLVNILAQRRAKWLLSRIGDLFAD